MNDKKRNVFFIGAGFSRPANIPIQDKILAEIIKPLDDVDFMTFDPNEQAESIKYMLCFIKVGIYLIENFTKEKLYEECEELKSIEKEEFYDKINIYYENRYKRIQYLKEKIRSKLEDLNIQVSLEDIFTFFDKSYQSMEFVKEYSFMKINEIKESITRLFIYCFCLCTNRHDFKNPDYVNFCKYVKKIGNATIISTNWDVLLEEYLERYNISYNLCLNEPYYIKENEKKSTEKKEEKVNLIKLHGSINWFRCLNCGVINIVNNKNCGRFLYDDNQIERCNHCKKSVTDDFLLQPEIITPTMFKSINNQLFNNIWSAAKHDLMNAEKITFIGYSLPTADFEIRCLLNKAVPPHIPIDVILHSSDDPSQTEKIKLKNLLPEKRYRDLFSQNELSFNYKGFGEYFNNV